MGKQSISKQISQAKQVKLLNDRCEFLYEEQQTMKQQINADGIEIEKLRQRVAELEGKPKPPEIITP